MKPPIDGAPELLRDVTRVVVPRDVADAVHAHLRAVGASRREGVGFWAGVVRNGIAYVEAALVPSQVSGNVGDGLAVVISGDELFRMNVWLHQNKMRLIAQVHSHPTDAYHSETDDDYAIIAETGGLSIVVPDFARSPFDVARIAAYRLSGSGRWDALSTQEVRSLIDLEE